MNINLVEASGDDTWMDDAACADVDDSVFYPDKGGSAAAGLAICAGCPVRGDCLEWSISEELHDGVLGGMTAQQRRKLRAERNAADPRRYSQRRWPQLHDRGWLQAQVDAGATQPQIAAQLGCSRTLVSAVMRELEVVPNRVAERADGQYRTDPRLTGVRSAAA